MVLRKARLGERGITSQQSRSQHPSACFGCPWDEPHPGIACLRLLWEKHRLKLDIKGEIILMRMDQVVAVTFGRHISHR